MCASGARIGYPRTDSAVSILGVASGPVHASKVVDGLVSMRCGRLYATDFSGTCRFTEFDLSHKRMRLGIALLAGAFLAGAAVAQEKDSFTPMALDSGFGKMDLEPPTQPSEEIIKKLAAK